MKLNWLNSVKLSEFKMHFERTARQINKIILHCSASDNASHDNIDTIREWHKRRGFIDIGYHYVITQKGFVFNGRDLFVTGAHCQGENINSIGICLTGRQFFKPAQFKAARNLCETLFVNFNLTQNDVYPHNYFNKFKTCPNFNLNKIFPCK
jgi:N-acetyl-anhydromuramyl-L-alanine amidase AmpD